VAKVQGMMPIVGRKQHVDKETDQVVEGGCLLSSVDVLVSDQFCGDTDWELVFADDEREANPTSFKFLQMAHAWKNSQARKTGASGLISGFTAATATSEDAVPSTSASANVDMARNTDVRSDASSLDDDE
jgi:crooked neck